MRRAHLQLLLLMLGLTALTSCKTNTPAPDSNRPAHHTDTGFQNLYTTPIAKGPIGFLKMRYFGDEPFADHSKEAHQIPLAEPDLDLIREPEDLPQVTWLGHSTFLIQYRGINILSDPILSQRASPVSFAGPERLVALPISSADLPPIDYVIISHNHYDHLDGKTIALLGDSPRYLVPLKLKDWFIDEGIAAEQILEFDWWDQYNDRRMIATATPSQHWSARGLFDRFETLWVAWHIQIDDFSLWFGGDTGYNPVQFKEIGQKFGQIDLGLIPIGAYAPRWFMEQQHVDPEQAIQIHKDIRADQSIGMHWGTFQLSGEPMMEPAQRIAVAAEKGLIKANEFLTLAIGETFTLSKRADPSPP